MECDNGAEESCGRGARVAISWRVLCYDGYEQSMQNNDQRRVPLRATLSAY